MEITNQTLWAIGLFGLMVGLILANVIQEARWKIKKKVESLWDDPEYDATDFAHPAFFRGETWSCYMFCKLMNEVLDGKNDCPGMMYEPLESTRNRIYKLKKEWDEAWDRVHDLENENRKYFEEKTKLQDDSDKLTIRILEVEKERDKLQEELDRHTKYEGGVSMKCGHPVQCLYACAKVDGGPVRCSMCDMKDERDRFKEYSYYVGEELTCKRVPEKYSPRLMTKINKRGE